MKITASLSSRLHNGKAEIMLRISVSHAGQFRVKSHLYINPDRFKDGRIIIPRYATPEQSELTELQSRLNGMLSALTDYCLAKSPHTSHELQGVAELYLNPKTIVSTQFWAAWEQWESQTKVSDLRHRRYKVLKGDLERWEKSRRKDLTLQLSSADLLDFERFLRDEYRTNKEVRMRGDNVINSLMTTLRTFVTYAVKTKLTAEDPFTDYTMPATIYGTPYFLTIEERDAIAECDYHSVAMNQQRDVFVFQCLTGCRVGDLLRLTKDNIVNGVLEYTPHKTMTKTGTAVRVPLCKRAQEILQRYPDGKKLLPFISSQKYNDAIKALMVFAKIDRKVTVINPITHAEERKPLYEVASSHLARRTFIGNLYRQVQDPNLIGSMSGHAEGSKAFSRYRTIDEDIKRKAIDLIE